MRQTLFHFLEGLSEKQVALKLGISLHTVHVYTTKLYRHFGVDSRGALVGRFVPRLDERALEHMIRVAGFRRRRIELKHWVRAATRVEVFAGAAPN
jgi:FixJ family two-component response regulator